MIKISRLVKKLPQVQRFISFHNPSGEDLIKRLGLLDQKNPIVIDVGANTGQTIDFILSLNPSAEIYSFEPTPDLIEGLKDRYKERKNVQIIDIALADRKGEMDFFTSAFSPTNSLLEPNTSIYAELGSIYYEPLSNSKKVKIKVDTFDAWYSINGKSKMIDLMKIDTQGTECEVLKGSILNLNTNVKAVCLEFQFLPFYKGCTPFYESMKILYENGFVLFSFFENSRRKNMQLVETNGLFINTSLVKYI
jgi:FkbM family methyltransferase